MTWEELWPLAEQIDGHYGLAPLEAEILWNTAYRVPVGGVIIELGVCHGRMAYLLTDIAERKEGLYIGVDTWGLEGSKEAVAEHLSSFPERHWVLYKGSTQEAPTFPCDLLFIDAGHDEANIKPDCERWIPMVKPGGLVAFHDYDEIPDPASCHWAVRHYADLHTGDWPLVAYYGGLLIRRRP